MAESQPFTIDPEHMKGWLNVQAKTNCKPPAAKAFPARDLEVIST